MKLHYAKRGAPYVAKLTDRSAFAVRVKARKMGLYSARSRHWQKWEIELLKIQWETKGPTVISRALGRKVSSVTHRASRLDLPSKIRRWTREEDRFIRRNFRKMTRKEMARVLDRSRNAVSMRMRNLGLRRYNLHQWTNRERIIVKRMYPKHSIAQIARRLNLRKKQVEGQISLMGLKRS